MMDIERYEYKDLKMENYNFNKEERDLHKVILLLYPPERHGFQRNIETVKRHLSNGNNREEIYEFMLYRDALDHIKRVVINETISLASKEFYENGEELRLNGLITNRELGVPSIVFSNEHMNFKVLAYAIATKIGPIVKSLEINHNLDLSVIQLEW